MATIYDVARRAEVSAATVSRVVNGLATVDPRLAERVHLAMRELAYRPNAVARSLRRSKTTLWAVIISDIGNPFFTAMVRGVEDVAQRAGFSVVLCNSDEDQAKEGRYVTAALAEQMAGVIISPSGGAAHVHQLLQAGVPVVVIDRELPGVSVDTVLVDNEHGAELAISHLIEAGCQRIACITGPRKVTTAMSRLRGYKKALKTHGQRADPGLIRHADYRQEGGYAAMAAMLDEGAHPDGVFIANNLMTIGAVECLVDRGLAIPNDVAVVGFDDIPWAHLVRPPLTTVAQPTYELGRTAALMLTERITEPTRPTSAITLNTQLKVRASSVRRQ
jgi:LacI family transcriptional regulator